MSGLLILFKKLKMLFILSLIALAVAGSSYIHYIWNKSMDTITDQALKSAMTAEAAFQKEVVSKLEANPKDIKKRVFQAAGGVGTTNHPFRYGEG